MANTIKPSQGRIVLVPHPTQGPNEDGSIEYMPAIITKVWNDDCVNVSIIVDGQGQPVPRSSCTFINEGDEVAAQSHRWMWPPRV